MSFRQLRVIEAVKHIIYNQVNNDSKGSLGGYLFVLNKRFMNFKREKQKESKLFSPTEHTYIESDKTYSSSVEVV